MERKIIDGEKIERIILQIYDILDKEDITGNEGCAIAGMILQTSCIGGVKAVIDDDNIKVYRKRG